MFRSGIGDRCDKRRESVTSTSSKENESRRLLRQNITDDDFRRPAVVFDRQFSLLRWVARYRQARDLLTNNPILLWCLVHIAEQERWRQSEEIELLDKPQRFILQRISSVDSQSAVRLLRKIEIGQGDKRELRLVLWAIRNPRVRKRLAHLPRIPISVIGFLQCFPEATDWRLVHSLPKKLPKELSPIYSLAYRYRQLWKDIIKLSDALGITNTDPLLAACRSLDELQHHHGTWTKRLNLLPPKLPPEPNPNRVGRIDRGWGIPPLPGNEYIHPILDAETLQEEGRQLSHCVGSYVNDVVDGKRFIYRVIWPERATLEIVLKPALSIGRCLLQNNKTPSAKTLSVVQHWFVEHTNNSYG